MAQPSKPLVQALRQTAKRLAREDSNYSWGHMGSCNCGHLAQTITSLSRDEIHRRAMERAGDWGQQALEACPKSGLAIDHVIESILELGLDRRDIEELEELSNRAVLARLPEEQRHLQRHRKDHAVLYLRAWADLLEEALPREEKAASRSAPERVHPAVLINA